MPLFKVIEIIDGNTIKVVGWKWNELSGNLVKIAGYNVDSKYSDFAKGKLVTLIKGKEVQLKKATQVTTTNSGDNVLNCAVILNDIDIAMYFPELHSA